MALWAKSQSLPADLLVQMRSIYEEHFPLEVRHFLAPWIEEKMWTDIAADLPQNEHYVEQFASELIRELETKVASMNCADMVITKMKLVDTINLFKHRYASCPQTLYHLVRRCFTAELKLVQQVEPTAGKITPCSSSRPDAKFEIARKIYELRQMAQETGEVLKHMGVHQEAFALLCHECSKSHANLQDVNSQPQTQQTTNMCKQFQVHRREQRERRLNHMAAELMQLRLTFTDKLQSTVNTLATLQARVLDEELVSWQREQRLASKGSSFNTKLDNIQEWCENLAEIIWFNRQQIKALERPRQTLGLNPPADGNLVPDLSSRLTQLLYSLVTRTFIIEKQPPQVMKTNTKFMSTVRFLVGGKLNVQMASPQVKVSIVSEAEANLLLKNIANVDNSGEIINSVATMEYHQATGHLTASFRCMQLKKIKRTEKKCTESVTDEKFSLLFQSEFSVGGGELVFQVWTLSLPVVVIVHENQEPRAWATVTWDNAFAEPERSPFAVPENVAWKAVAEALNRKFCSATGRPLSDDNLHFLAEKAFRFLNCSDYSSILLSWSQFCKEPLPERGFTFWEWFYGVMKLTRDHLRCLWSDGLIHGFAKKEKAGDMLSPCANGTFLLRFSDSELGAISIAFVKDGNDCHLRPFTSKDIVIRSLPDRIARLVLIVHLYPDVSKEEAFGKFYTPQDNLLFSPELACGLDGYLFSMGHSWFHEHISGFT